MAEFEGWPEGHTNYILCKTLAGADAAGPLEILHFTLVFFSGRARPESAEIAPLAGLRIDLAGIEPVLTRSLIYGSWGLPIRLE